MCIIMCYLLCLGLWLVRTIFVAKYLPVRTPFQYYACAVLHDYKQQKGDMQEYCICKGVCTNEKKQWIIWNAQKAKIYAHMYTLPVSSFVWTDDLSWCIAETTWEKMCTLNCSFTLNSSRTCISCNLGWSKKPTHQNNFTMVMSDGPWTLWSYTILCWWWICPSKQEVCRDVLFKGATHESSHY